MSAGELIAVVAVVFLAATVQTTTGFGFSLTAVPLMALAVDTRTASMLAAILSLTTSALQARQGRADTVWPLAKRLCVAAAIGMPVGLLMFARADDQFCGSSSASRRSSWSPCSSTGSICRMPGAGSIGSPARWPAC